MTNAQKIVLIVNLIDAGLITIKQAHKLITFEILVDPDSDAYLIHDTSGKHATLKVAHGPDGLQLFEIPPEIPLEMETVG